MHSPEEARDERRGEVIGLAAVAGLIELIARGELGG
jgi:hypothetical protein